MGYPGAKNAAGVYQRIINEMPPHEVYLEAFVGGGAIYLRKKPARSSIVIDADERVAAHWSTIARCGGNRSLTAVHGDARSVIASYGERIRPDWLIYCDPPYVLSSRRSGAPLYRHEMTDQAHRELLELLATLPAAVMVSGYRHPIYDELLAGWRRLDYRVMTHQGIALESLWLNFEATARHELTYLGRDFRERERIKKKKTRWRARLAAMPTLERAAVLEVLLELAPPRAAVEAIAARDLTAAGGGEDLTARNDERRRPATPGAAVLQEFTTTNQEARK